MRHPAPKPSPEKPDTRKWEVADYRQYARNSRLVPLAAVFTVMQEGTERFPQDAPLRLEFGRVCNLMVSDQTRHGNHARAKNFLGLGRTQLGIAMRLDHDMTVTSREYFHLLKKRGEFGQTQAVDFPRIEKIFAGKYPVARETADAEFYAGAGEFYLLWAKGIIDNREKWWVRMACARSCLHTANSLYERAGRLDNKLRKDLAYAVELSRQPYTPRDDKIFANRMSEKIQEMGKNAGTTLSPPANS